MGETTKISWCDSTLNVVTGCTPIGDDCKNCYARTFAERWRGVPNHPFTQGFDLRLYPERISTYLNKTKPRKIFLCSMGDLFHKDVPVEFIQKVFEMMNLASQHMFQVLTKRPELMREYTIGPIPLVQFWTRNIWAGTTVGSAKYLHRLESLKEVPAHVRFLSIEPLIGPIQDIDLTGINQVIVGGESGRGCRPMDVNWARRIRDICREQGVAFFFKQHGGQSKDKGGNILDGEIIQEWPNNVYYPKGLNPYE